MKFLAALIALTSLNVCASSWVYSDEKDLMTNISIYKAEIKQADTTAKFQCNYPDGVVMGIYTESDGLSIATSQMMLRYKIDNSEVFTDNVSIFQKEGILHFKISNDLFFDSKAHLFSGKILKIELTDSFEDKVYREISLENSFKALRKAFTNCNSDFIKVAETEREAARAATIVAAIKTKEEEEKQRLIDAATEQRKSEEAQIMQSISDLIQDRIAAVWIRPPNARNNMKTQLRVSFLPTGEVSQVDVTKGSGDALFDQRAVDAVKNATKIEELAQLDSDVFERNFRQVDLIFNPQDLRK